MIISKVSHSTESVAQHYDELDEFYREFWGDHLHHGLWISGKESPKTAVKNLIEYAVEHLYLEPGMNVCDVGCGYGATSLMLAEQWQVNVTAFTISKAQYHYAISQSRHLKNPPEYLQQDWLKNSLPSASMDRILAIESSEHFENKAAFMQEAYRILRPGGRLAICAWLVKEPCSSFDEHYLLEPICREGCLPNMGSKADYERWILETGFSNIQYIDLSKNVKKTWSICIQQVLKGLFTNASLRSFVFNGASPNRAFFNTVFRIWLAYTKGCLQYGLFLVQK